MQRNNMSTIQKKTILRYEDLAAVQPGTSTEELVNIQIYDTTIVGQYAKKDMQLYTGETILVRDMLAKKLARVNQSLQSAGYRLKIVYGYRHPAVQNAYFAARKSEIKREFPYMDEAQLERYTHNFVAIPDVAGHPAGAAVDLTLVDSAGNELDMGTAIADYADPLKIQTFVQTISPAQRANRQILHNAMIGQGFAPFYGEWWHFSYGDREWAAFYDKKAALYGPLDLPVLISAAGGNTTAIRILEQPLSRTEYATHGKALGQAMEQSGAEQTGFLIRSQRHFEMAGGEFCGNASRAAALLFSELNKTNKVLFTVSGFNGAVHAVVNKLTSLTYDVSCEFPGMAIDIRQITLNNGQDVNIVDLGGIVHVVIEDTFPSEPAAYQDAHSAIMQELGLSGHEAVGVVWFQQNEGAVSICPVVWVNAVNTFFYEESCGSGTIAVGKVTGASSIIQPTGKSITATITNSTVILQSEMEIIH